MNNMVGPIRGHNLFSRTNNPGVIKAGIGIIHTKKPMEIEELDEIVDTFDSNDQWVLDYIAMRARRRAYYDNQRH